MKILKKIGLAIGIMLAIPVAYLLVSLLLTTITVNSEDEGNNTRTIYLNTNGVHLDIILPKENISIELLDGIHHLESEQYLSFGWGEENFYLNTPTWGDLTAKNAFTALFMNTPTLMHVTRYENQYNDWVEIKVSEQELKSLNQYLQSSFALNKEGDKLLLEGKGYDLNDDFYRANGSYSAFNTCNSWVNSAFKVNGLKACYWTPFDFGLMKKYTSQ